MGQKNSLAPFCEGANELLSYYEVLLPKTAVKLER
jgi:hypothetical protein